MSEDDPRYASDYGLPRRVITCLLFGLAGFFAILSFAAGNDKGKIALYSVGFAVLAVIWPLVSKFETLRFGLSGIELSKKVDEANAKADIALATLTRFVFNSMPHPTFNNLRKIDSGRFGSFDMTDNFREQLRTLRNSGYIGTNNVFISEIPASGAELSDFVYCTDLGKEFIKQRLAAEGAVR